MHSFSTLNSKDFEVLKELGSGSFGKVSLARKKSDQELYAIKVVLMTRLNQKERQSALNEVRLLASINIANVISYKGSFFNNQNQSLCVVMEYADGGDLEGKINDQFKINEQLKISEKKGFDEYFIWKVAFELFQGIKTLHHNNIIHRDIKSANVFFVNGIAKLGDLNVSRVVEGDMATTQAGTPYYTSPEIWKGTKYGRKCDIWSLGCLLYEMCTLDPPFKARDFPSLYRKVIVGDYQPIPSCYSKDLSDIIRMCLTVDEDRRPDARELLETPILSGMELSLEKFRSEEESIVLIDPIKCPRVLRFLNTKLPKATFEQKAKKTVGFKSKANKEAEDDMETNDAYNRAKSLKFIRAKAQISAKYDAPFQPHSKNRIVLPPVQQPLQFAIKKPRPGLKSEKKIGLQREESSIEKKNNIKDIRQSPSKRFERSKKKIASRKFIKADKENNVE